MSGNGSNNKSGDFNSKVKAFVNSLNEEQKRALYKKLASMPESERNKYLSWLIRTKEQKDAQKNSQKNVRKNTGNVEKNTQKNVQNNAQKNVQTKSGQSSQKNSGRPETKSAPAAQRKSQVKGAEAPTNQQKAHVKNVTANITEDTGISDKNTAPEKSTGVKGLVAGVVAAFLVLLVIFGIVYGWFGKIADKFKVDNTDTSAEVSVTAEPTVAATEAPVVTETVPTPTPTPEPTPEPQITPVREDAPDLTGLVIVIDPGHQQTTSTETEPVASWLSTEKSNCTCGCVGIVSNVPEYELTLSISLQLKDYLEQLGATVILTRTENDVDISNSERALIAVENEADIFIRIHADASNDSSFSGVNVYVPDSGNYTGVSVGQGDNLGNLVAEELGTAFNGTRQTYLYTGLNYANTIPSFQICLGYLSNSDDDALLNDPQMQYNICAGIAVFCGSFM